MAWTKAEFDQFYRFAIDAHWGRPAGAGKIDLHYHHFVVGQPQSSYYAPLLASVCGITSASVVCIVGSGFNWTGKGLNEATGALVYGVDTSTYIVDNASLTEETELRDLIGAAGHDPDAYTIPAKGDAVQRGWSGQNILDLILDGGRAAPKARGFGSIYAYDLSKAGDRNKLKRDIAGDLTHLITEETLNSVADADAVQICDAAEAVKTDLGAVGCEVFHALSPLQLGGSQNPLLNWKLYSEWRSFLNANGFTAHHIVPTVGSESEGVTAYQGLL